MIEELQRFILVSNEKNLTKVAKKIYITQSALTQSIQRLEKELNTKLFIQKGKYLQLTADGQALNSIGRKIIDLWEKAKNPEIRKIIKPTITIGMFDNAAMHLATFVKKNVCSSQYNLEFVIDSSGRLISDLQLGTIDIAISVISKKYTDSKNLICIESFEEELIPVASKQFKETIDNIPFILYKFGSYTREQIDEIFAKNSIKPLIYAESTSTAFMKELALLGCGIALLPKNSVSQELKEKTLINHPLSIQWKRKYGIFVSKNNIENNTKEIIEDIVKILDEKEPYKIKLKIL